MCLLAVTLSLGCSGEELSSGGAETGGASGVDAAGGSSASAGGGQSGSAGEGSGGVGGTAGTAGSSAGSGGSAVDAGADSGTIGPPSCAGLAPTCGPNADEDCCASPLIAGDLYNRSNDAAYPATVSDFRLDRFEVTVGRFRKFVDAYPTSKPAAGAAAHPLIAGSGWQVAWDAELPVDSVAMLATNTIVTVKCSDAYQTWTDDPAANESLPMNCLSWHLAFAFCAWDGGRLPTEAEWNYAAAGGNYQRKYPWGPAVPDPSYASYDCSGDGSLAQQCALSDILSVGSKPKGDGRFAQADLAGNVAEWNLDWFAEYATPCHDCANLAPASTRVVRGGSFEGADGPLASTYRSSGTPNGENHIRGVRCARSP